MMSYVLQKLEWLMHVLMQVHVQSDPAGRLIVTGEPEQLDNPWGVTPFKKVIRLPSRIDPHQTSAVVTLHGQLFVRAPFEQSK
ncbi:AT-rich interactive domain-containing protein 3 [Zea mays]|uniref:AT-rich interactive domain-containing protein 3 n=1 Tax=Zea mays TaxID=4577 RepID=A0A1D6P4Q0_MAIZE|nr:AT-rich interactive domain-containing protein 3 [Zea mays]AQL04928.1 AT-rich interactive domain-containing protein 3 [Zea mays]